MAHHLDYNLLQTFVLLYKHKNLKAVGRALGVTESAVSKHLSKLREQLDDQLFVRDSHGFEPTSFTERVIPTLTDGLNTIQSALAKDTIDCENYTGDIAIALIPIMHMRIGAELLIDLKNLFPQASISLFTYDNDTTQDISNGTIDLAVNYFNPTLSKSMYQGHINKTKHGVILPAQCASLSDEEMLNLPFVGLKARGRNDIKTLLDDVYDKVSLELNFYANVDNFMSLLNTIERIEGIAFVQAFKITDERFVIRSLPEEFRHVDNFSLVGVMKASNKSNPLHILLLDLIKRKIESFSMT